jgi:hypothetical protein
LHAAVLSWIRNEEEVLIDKQSENQSHEEDRIEPAIYPVLPRDPLKIPVKSNKRPSELAKEEMRSV